MADKHKRKHPRHYVEPEFHVGEIVILHGERCKVEKIHDNRTGNRPMYKLVGKQTIYPETFLRKVEKVSE